jgi:cation diffusion facilitator CzcD-associated flavoprotein CzcO
MDDRLLVIGAGPTGLAMAKALKEAGIAYTQVEATDHVGGNWAHGVYETAHIISSRRTTEYEDFPMPADWPDFPSAAQMKQYFEAYAAANQLEVDFGRTVTRVEPAWTVTFADGAVERFKGVVVCNGHHWSRSFPAWVADFRGEVIHSKDYKRPDELRDRRVLVLGGGNSGCDLVSEAARVGASADWSLRRGYWFLPKTLFGVPTVELMKPWLPVWAQRLFIRAALRVVVGRYEDYGLPRPDHAMFEAHPTVNSEVFHYLKHGRITMRPDVAGVDGTTVRFTDGSAATYDLVVCATGFDVAFPFLPPGAVPVRGKVPQLYAGMLRPEYRHLYVVGGYQPRYGIGPLLRPLALLLAQWVRLQDEVDVPLGEVLRRLGLRPPTTHLVDPHRAIRQLRWAQRLLPLLRWRAKRMRVVPAAAVG